MGASFVPRSLLVAFFAVALLGGAGCGAGAENAKPAKPRAAGPSASGGVGVIRGTVSLKGEAPEMREIPNQPCHAGATPAREETVVADEQGRLANVVVFVREAPAANVPPPASPVELDQLNCRYAPHVLAMRAGQVLRVKSSDPAVHNVHTMSSANPAQNFGMQGGARPVDLKLDRPEEFAVRCDVHPWMNARIHVFEHGHFAVTGEDGSFTLNAVPAGQYTLVFRHELFGDIEEVIDVADGQVLAHDAAYEKP